jgi:hypothetical protein
MEARGEKTDELKENKRRIKKKLAHNQELEKAPVTC